MRAFTLKGLFLTATFMLLGSLATHAADDDLITEQITVKLNEAGTLSDKIDSDKKYKITNLKIVGEINGTDFLLIRDMAGMGYRGQPTEGNMSILDLSEAKIVKGGNPYLAGESTSDDAIGDNTFLNCFKLTSITIPSNVTRIGRDAFWGCSGLTSFTIPSSVTSINYEAFKNCTSLTNINIPSSVTSIGYGVFDGCSSLVSVSIPSSITSIKEFTFEGCRSLTNITIPSSVTSIGYRAFSSCSSLTNIVIPSSVTSIGDTAFKGCSSLTSVTIPSSITSIGNEVFSGCIGLTSIVIPSSVTSIGSNAFYECSSLTNVTIPSSVTSIDICAFYGCSGLTSITFPSSVTSIDDYAFWGCNGLTYIYVCWEVPITINHTIFTVDKKACTLYVPQGTSPIYKQANVWGDFENIVEYEVTTGIDKASTAICTTEVSRYAADGKRLDAPAKGMNIVKYSDGTVKKVVMK